MLRFKHKNLKKTKEMVVLNCKTVFDYINDLVLTPVFN